MTRRWGPLFALDPIFTEHDVFLLGRADFFRRFTIEFAETNGVPAFSIEY